MTQTVANTRTYSVEEFEALPEFAGRFELIAGILMEKEMVGFEHALIAEIIREALRLFDPEKKLGLMVQETSVRLGPKSAPLPDLSFWKAAHRPRRTKGTASLPDLAVTIWSPGDLDDRKALEAARAKVLRYLLAGVLLVWAINPGNQTVEVYRTGQSEPSVLNLHDTLDGEDIIPGFKLPLKALFENE